MNLSADVSPCTFFLQLFLYYECGIISAASSPRALYHGSRSSSSSSRRGYLYDLTPSSLSLRTYSSSSSMPPSHLGSVSLRGGGRVEGGGSLVMSPLWNPFSNELGTPSWRPLVGGRLGCVIVYIAPYDNRPAGLICV